MLLDLMLLELTMQCLCQDPERRVCPQPLPVCELRWDGLLRGGHEGRQYLRDGRPQVPVRHTKLQPLHWFSTALWWGDVCVCLCMRCLAVFFDGWRFLDSFLISVSEFRLIPSSNASRATQFSREVLRSQGEWEFLHLSITNANFTYYSKTWEQLIYTVRTNFFNFGHSKPVLKGTDGEVVICDTLKYTKKLNLGCLWLWLSIVHCE